MIKNILFDMGGVIIPISHERAVSRFREIGLLDADKRLDSYTQQGIFGALEEGKITDEEFRCELSLLVGVELTWEQCQYAWLGYMLEVPRRNLETLQCLRNEGYRVILLSNTNPFIIRWAMSNEFDGQGHGIDYYLDAAYMSFRCGSMKPSEAFFCHVLQTEGILPEETLFLDDGIRNIEAAGRFGIHTFLVENGSDWTESIRTIISLSQ